MSGEEVRERETQTLKQVSDSELSDYMKLKKMSSAQQKYLQKNEKAT